MINPDETKKQVSMGFLEPMYASQPYRRGNWKPITFERTNLTISSSANQTATFYESMLLSNLSGRNKVALMFKKFKNLVTVFNALTLLSCSSFLMQPASAAGEKAQSDVDAVKTSKDDNQHQQSASKNSYKKGTPLPFEGPPAKSKNADSKTTTKSPKNYKP